MIASFRHFWFALGLFTVAVNGYGTTPAYADGQRIAVVVGVSHYSDPDMTPLPNAVADAQQLAALLKAKHGYSDVRLLTSTDGKHVKAEHIETAWQSAVNDLNGDDTIVFFFAGHGIELKGRNYLLGSDVDKDGETETNVGSVTRTSVDLQKLIEVLGVKQFDHKDVVGIIILDACRENPFPLDPAKMDAQPVGLGPTALPPSEIFILYSAGIGQKAIEKFGDAKPSTNSPFMTALTAELANQDTALPDLASQVKIKVYREVYERGQGAVQSPAYYNQLKVRRTVGGVRDPQRIAPSAPNAFVQLPWKLAPKDVIIECALCPEMVVVKGDKFSRGDKAIAYASPTPVTIEQNFAIGKFEVTNQQWDACVADTGATVRCQGTLRAPPEAHDAALKPVTGVTWDDATIYTRWLSEKTGATYRLPTEAEWEFAARAGSQTAYSFGGDYKTELCKFANGADRSVGVLTSSYHTCTDDVGRSLAQVGSFRPNKLGLFDVHGNAWEWVQDCWIPSYSAAPTDGTATASATQGADCSLRAARGGSWRSGVTALQSAARNAFAQGHRRGTLGFRVVRVINAAK